MNISEARKTHLMDYLNQNGHKPIKIQYGNAWFISPMRQEKTPSFKVHLSRNVWYDFGSGEGGNLIDLVMKLHNTSFRETIDLIGRNSFSPVNYIQSCLADESGKIKIDSIQSLSNPVLIQYLKSRAIALPFARLFLKEAFYTVHDRKYFALAFKNDKDGYELRNAFFKTGSSPKYFTTIPGTDNSILNVFEGFMDFLSCCTYYNKIPRFRTIVLNSLSFLPRIDSELEQAREVNLFLDNDSAGIGATQKIVNRDMQVKDWAPVLYPTHKDFNDFLTNSGVR
jgi:DNA primase